MFKPIPHSTGERIVILDTKKRAEAPVGRSGVTIEHIRNDGWVNVKYDDGTNDSFTYELIIKHWGVPFSNTPLWIAINAHKCP